MAHAKTLTDEQLDALLLGISKPRDLAITALTYEAGLRVKEAATLYVEDITDVHGNLADSIQITRRGAKGKKPRRVPMTNRLRAVLAGYLEHEGLTEGPLFYNQFGGPLTAHAAGMQLARIYENAGYVGASSHSGRRTFGTRAARKAIQEDGYNLVDVSKLMGHADVRSTEAYIDLADTHSPLIESLYEKSRLIAAGTQRIAADRTRRDESAMPVASNDAPHWSAIRRGPPASAGPPNRREDRSYDASVNAKMIDCPPLQLPAPPAAGRELALTGSQDLPGVQDNGSHNPLPRSSVLPWPSHRYPGLGARSFARRAR